MRTELDFIDDLGQFIYDNLKPEDSIKVRSQLFRRLKELKRSYMEKV